MNGDVAYWDPDGVAVLRWAVTARIILDPVDADRRDMDADGSAIDGGEVDADRRDVDSSGVDGRRREGNNRRELSVRPSEPLMQEHS